MANTPRVALLTSSRHGFLVDSLKAPSISSNVSLVVGPDTIIPKDRKHGTRSTFCNRLGTHLEKVKGYRVSFVEGRGDDDGGRPPSAKLGGCEA